MNTVAVQKRNSVRADTYPCVSKYRTRTTLFEFMGIIWLCNCGKEIAFFGSDACTYVFDWSTVDKLLLLCSDTIIAIAEIADSTVTKLINQHFQP